MPTRQAARLLIADDDADLLAAYALYFAEQGFDIRTARDGLDAFAQYCAWHPDAALLDVEMPRLDGRALARRIRYVGDVPAPTLVAVSGLERAEERSASLRSGFDHHFVKPAPMQVILAVLNGSARH
ncbi:response regulator [Paraburkholderia sp. D15]|uniref:response regulator n=1 Tax=Paraburkholderia sp. D15 TaxID=2880218 RepID=UPI002478B13B|nr:response regulator [Paraburkholderia sp. D15]WGS48126.1 response regulator [Paraburkholderia sp. D15]